MIMLHKKRKGGRTKNISIMVKPRSERGECSEPHSSLTNTTVYMMLRLTREDKCLMDHDNTELGDRQLISYKHPVRSNCASKASLDPCQHRTGDRSKRVHRLYRSFHASPSQYFQRFWEGPQLSHLLSPENWNIN